MRNGKEIDLEKLINRGVFPGLQGGPHEHIVAAKAVAFGEVLYGSSWESELTDKTFAGYTRRVIDNARVLAQELMQAGRAVET